MIFGIVGKFGIEIGDRDVFPENIFDRKNFHRKKENIFSEKNLDHLFRSQISQRFQKSYLENVLINGTDSRHL